jgi:hypothetical protein
VHKVKKENKKKITEIGSDFNYLDPAYEAYISHEVRLNKRPITAKPGENFGTFTQNLFAIDNS